MSELTDVSLCFHHKVGEQTVAWHHLEDFYNIDSRSVIRMAPKLTRRHFDLPPFTNMRVKLATQVFSHSVAAGKKAVTPYC